MSNSKIITDYTRYEDDTLNTTAAAGIKGTTASKAFVFANKELTNAAAAQAAYSDALDNVPTGTDADITDKNTAKAALIKALSILCTQINVQAGGDLATLQGTGFPLAKEPAHHAMGVTVNFVVDRGVQAGSFVLSVDKPENYSDHGAVFAFWNPIYGPAPASPDDWFHRSCNGHSMTLKGFAPGTAYPFSSAYKGSDSDPLVWSPIVTKMAGD